MTMHRHRGPTFGDVKKLHLVIRTVLIRNISAIELQGYSLFILLSWYGIAQQSFDLFCSTQETQVLPLLCLILSQYVKTCSILYDLSSILTFKGDCKCRCE
jgi:hypothetical protein